MPIMVVRHGNALGAIVRQRSKRAHHINARRREQQSMITQMFRDQATENHIARQVACD